MAITGIGGASALTLQTIGDMRVQLDDLQRQLGSGMKSTSYAGLGVDSGLAVGLRSQLSAIDGYQQSITQVGVRLDLMQTALTQFDSLSQQTKSKILQSQYSLGGTSQTQDQTNAKGILDSLIGMLNTSADGRYLFSGRTVEAAAAYQRAEALRRVAATRVEEILKARDKAERKEQDELSVIRFSTS